MSENPAHLYREVAKKIVAKQKQNIVELIELNKMPDLYWKLEQAIVDAMKHADSMGQERAREQFNEFLRDFEQNDGSSSS